MGQSAYLQRKAGIAQEGYLSGLPSFTGNGTTIVSFTIATGFAGAITGGAVTAFGWQGYVVINTNNNGSLACTAYSTSGVFTNAAQYFVSCFLTGW